MFKKIFVLLLFCTSLLAVNAAFAKKMLLVDNTANEFSLKQRNVKEISTSSGSVYISIGDITAGQVMTSVYFVPLSGNDENKQVTLLNITSMYAATSREFTFDNQVYTLRLKLLHNSLLGQDFALFELIPKEMKSDEDTNSFA